MAILNFHESRITIDQEKATCTQLRVLEKATRTQLRVLEKATCTRLRVHQYNLRAQRACAAEGTVSRPL